MAPARAKKATLTVNRRPRASAKRTTRQTNATDKKLGPGDQSRANTMSHGRPADSSIQHVENPNSDQNTAELARDLAVMRAELEKERLQNAELRKRIEDMPSNGGQDASAKPIPRPQGTAGTNFSIQEEMGLAGSNKKYETYKAIQRNLRDLAMNARINWEVPWAQVPARDKAKLFEVAIIHEARDQHPFLARFERDWATEEIVKQFVKNKRKNHYTNGWLEVPEKYAYLKQNAMRRNRTASRSKRALAVVDGGADPGPSGAPAGGIEG